MAADELQIIPPDRRRHAEALFDMIGKVYERYFECRDLHRVLLEHSHYDWRASRIGLLGGRIVTHWGVWDYRMRIGTACVRVGGVGAVATHGDFRKRGFMTRTATASIEAMEELGYDVTILSGIGDFYHRFGYVRAWPEVTYFVAVKDLPSERPGVVVRKFAVRDRPDIAELFNREHARVTGTAVRPTYTGKSSRQPKQTGYLWCGARGRVAGYVIVGDHEGQLEHLESAGQVEQILRILSMLARRCGSREVRFPALPYGTALCKRLRRGNCRLQIGYRRSGGMMIRTISLRSTLEKMAGELSRRLKGSHLAKWRGNLLIGDPREKVTLAIDRSQVRIARGAGVKNMIRGAEQIAQLLIGTDEPDEIVAAGQLRLTGEARRLIGVLFGNQHPMLHLRDGY